MDKSAAPDTKKDRKGAGPPPPALDERELRTRMSRFVHSHARTRDSLRTTLAKLAETNWEPILFGGVPRDLAMFAGSVLPRDVDVVLASGTTMDDVIRHVGDLAKRKNRFGGVKLMANGWRFDVWSLSETWAFQSGIVPLTGLDALPKTTFLNTEAIAIELAARPGRARRVFEHGFFRALETRTLDINLEENPFPELCVVRTLFAATRLQFALSPRLLRYVDHHAQTTDIDSLLGVQAQHYGAVRRFAGELRLWVSSIRSHVRRSPNRPMHLPSSFPIQLDFWSSAQFGWPDEQVGLVAV